MKSAKGVRKSGQTSAPTEFILLYIILLLSKKRRLQTGCSGWQRHFFSSCHQTKSTQIIKKMKKVFQSMFQVAAFCTLLFACKKESIQGDHSLQTFDAGPSVNGMVASPKTYTLIKHGQDTVIFKDGQISKVQRDAANFTNYYYGESSAYTVTYINGQVDNEIQYLYFPNGKVERTMHKTWPVVNGVPTLKEVFYYYNYSADGKLKKRYNVNAPGRTFGVHLRFKWQSERGAVFLYRQRPAIS
jgi:hypothetical protein